jgi:hypothetical protein
LTWQLQQLLSLKDLLQQLLLLLVQRWVCWLLAAAPAAWSGTVHCPEPLA